MSRRLKRSVGRLSRWVWNHSPAPGAGVQAPAHGPHSVPVERWQVQGHLQTVDAGPAQTFGFGLRLSKVAAPLPARLQGWSALFSFLDAGAQRHAVEERLVFPPRTALAASGTPVSFRVGAGKTLERADDWLLEGGVGTWAVRARLEDGRGVDLDLQRTTEPLALAGLLGPTPGRERFANWEAETRLTVAGTAFDGVRLRRVAGLAWHDHQWGATTPRSGGVHKVLRVHLDSGHNVFAQCEPSADSRPAPAQIVIVGPDGAASPVLQGASEDRGSAGGVEGTDVRPGTLLTAEGLSLEVTPLVGDQRSRTTAALQASSVCWRGTCSAEGVLASRPVTGWATVEVASAG